MWTSPLISHPLNLDKFHDIFTDRLYTSIELATRLLRRNTYLTCTIRTNSAGLPVDLSPSVAPTKPTWPHWCSCQRQKGAHSMSSRMDPSHSPHRRSYLITVYTARYAFRENRVWKSLRWIWVQNNSFTQYISIKWTDLVSKHTREFYFV